MQKQFGQLTAFLSEYEALWRERPFTKEHLSWESRFPALRPTLLSLDDDVLTAAEEDATYLSSNVPELRALIAEAKHLASRPNIDDGNPCITSIQMRAIREVKMRKKTQIGAIVWGHSS